MVIKNFTIRIDESLLHKLHFIARYEGRSANGQCMVIIRRCVKDFEDKHGSIN